MFDLPQGSLQGKWALPSRWASAAFARPRGKLHPYRAYDPGTGKTVSGSFVPDQWADPASAAFVGQITEFQAVGLT